MANPGVAIRLSNENKTIIKTNGNGDLKTVVYSLYGKETTDGLIDIEYQYEGIRVTGVIGKPEIARSNRTYQQFFVNKRFIKDKTLQASAEQAFKGLLPIGKFGFLILNIEIEPKRIDVNVHPTKLEIRFQEEQKIFKAVYHAIREGLLKSDLVKNTEKTEEETEKNIINEPKTNISATIQESLQNDEGENKCIKKATEINGELSEDAKNDMQKTQMFEPIEPEEKTTKTSGLFGIFKKKEAIEENVENNAIEEIFVYKSEATPKTIENNKKLEVDFNKMYSETFGIKKEEKNEEAEKVTQYSFANSKQSSLFEDSEEYSQIPTYKYCGAIFSTYLIIEMGNEAYIIDQHAAHERVMYEEIKKNYYKTAEKESQIMLLPDIINLSHKEKNIVRENVDLFKKAGFMIEEFGENAIRLIGVPSICIDMDTKELFLEILDTIDTVAITAKQEKEDKFIATIACKAAVKAKMALTKEEVDNLMKKLLVLPNPFTCPHGRPTAIKMDKTDIERKFNRRK